MEPRTAAAYMAEALAFGENFKDVHDMAAAMRQGPAPLGGESALAIRTELSRLEGGRASELSSAEKVRQAALTAQATLLFAWAFEERIMDLERLDESLSEDMEALRRTIGLDEDDEDDGGLVEALAEASRSRARDELAASWRTVLRAMAVFAPKASFVTCEQAVADDLAEAGVALVPAPGDAGLGEGALCADVPLSLLNAAALSAGAGEGAQGGSVRVYFLPVS
ncbi:hypothetical protein [Desulfovibrio sp. X2]|uniref:hypothetical protein n=1 Tax=Desulfovibrio sp. X2 TaxID=941449 RepID=UPI0005518602|nr:hypothetical protein [Desulfovibrio sp. X2]